jgi:hypothetical protein
MPPTANPSPQLKSLPSPHKSPQLLCSPLNSSHTIIVFDWDDTLLASSFLSSRNLRLDTAAHRLTEVDAGLRELEQSVISVLTLAMSYGEVHIVTNAETGWVQLSAAKFIPAVVPLLSQVAVLSARSTYECRYPDSPLKWKFYAFQEKLSTVFNDVKAMKNIISFGDSHVEREAVRAVTRGFPNTRTKSVKFAERPTMEQLRRQIELVTNCFQYIANHEGDLDLQLTVTINNNNSPVTPPVNASQLPIDNGSAASSEMYTKTQENIHNHIIAEEKPIAV